MKILVAQILTAVYTEFKH